MVLVPADTYEKSLKESSDMKTVYSLPHPALTTSKTTKLLSLDDQLKDTLLNPHVDSDLKARLYQDILQEY